MDIGKENGVTKLGTPTATVTGRAWSPPPGSRSGPELGHWVTGSRRSRRVLGRPGIPTRGALTCCTPRTGPAPLGPHVPREGEGRGGLPHDSAQQTGIPAATHHRRSQFQAQRTPADDQGQDPQQADPGAMKANQDPPGEGECGGAVHATCQDAGQRARPQGKHPWGSAHTGSVAPPQADPVRDQLRKEGEEGLTRGDWLGRLPHPWVAGPPLTRRGCP